LFALYLLFAATDTLLSRMYTHTLLSGHRTIARSCISSVACTPWSISSLNCCTRLVVYFLSNEISSLNCCTRLYICFTCLTSHLCALQLYLLDVSFPTCAVHQVMGPAPSLHWHSLCVISGTSCCQAVLRPHPPCHVSGMYCRRAVNQDIVSL